MELVVSVDARKRGEAAERDCRKRLEAEMHNPFQLSTIITMGAILT